MSEAETTRILGAIHGTGRPSIFRSVTAHVSSNAGETNVLNKVLIVARLDEVVLGRFGIDPLIFDKRIRAQAVDLTVAAVDWADETQTRAEILAALIAEPVSGAETLGLRLLTPDSNTMVVELPVTRETAPLEANADYGESGQGGRAYGILLRWVPDEELDVDLEPYADPAAHVSCEWFGAVTTAPFRITA